MRDVGRARHVRYAHHTRPSFAANSGAWIQSSRKKVWGWGQISLDPYSAWVMCYFQAQLVFFTMLVLDCTRARDCQLRSFDVSRVDKDEWLRHCFHFQQPCFFINALSEWPALKKWRKDEGLFKEYGVLRVQSGERSEIPLVGGVTSIESSLQTFLELNNSTQGAKNSVFVMFPTLQKLNKRYHKEKLLARFSLDAPQIPNALFHAFTAHTPMSKDSFEQYKFLSMGGSGGGIDYHDHGDTIFGLVRGTKEWFIYEPGNMPERVIRELDLMVKGNWKNVSFSTRDEEPMRCVQPEGTLFFLPELYHHATENTEGSVIGVGWQLQPNARRVLKTAKAILLKEPQNAFALQQSHWFSTNKTMTDPELLLDLATHKNPRDLTVLSVAIQAVCNAIRTKRVRLKGKQLLEFGTKKKLWRQQVETLLHSWRDNILFLSTKITAPTHNISLPVFKISILNLITAVDEYAECSAYREHGDIVYHLLGALKSVDPAAHRMLLRQKEHHWITPKSIEL